jgi:diadenosine tetraphosphatase ApaH/serine/threonine PP2A family protein phosphatase
VLADAAAAGAERLLCLGDVVGYGADPGPCLDLVAARAAAIVAGNHEHGAIGRLALDWFNPAARAATEWTAARLAPDTRRWLDALPVLAREGDATLVHGSPEEPEAWDYLATATDGFAVFGAFDTRLCFVGHSHRPAVWSVGTSGPDHRAGFRAWPARVALRPGRRYLINVGSVGQPRDGDARAAYALWDVEARRVDIRRVPYDVRAAADKILAAGLPPILGERLARGF